MVATMQSTNYWDKKQGHELFEQALRLEADGKTREAVEAYQKSLDLCPNNGQAHYNLGIALATTGQADQAIRAWKRAIWLDISFRHELSKAFDLDDEIREEIPGGDRCEHFAKAA